MGATGDEATRNAPVIERIREVGEAVRHAYTAGAKDVVALKATTTRVVRRAFGDIGQLLAADTELDNDWGDTIVRLELLWSDVTRTWDDVSGKPAAVAHLKPPLRTLLVECAFQTVPERLRDNLHAVRIGTVVDFRAEFKDELPDDPLLDEVLQWLYDHPVKTPAIIDVRRHVVI